MPHDNDPLLDIAKDPVRAQALRQSLERLAGGAGGSALADMASDVLAGRTDLRSAVLSGTYTEALNSRMQQFSSWYQNLSDQEKEEQAERARAHLEQLRQGDQPEPPDPPRRPGPPTDDDSDDEPPATFLRDAW
ncbi:MULTISPECIES: hypothetical protein [unclassified Crossiella]|uniref:hypothetical protein n=1 Tax=unclassified Crossiella TaxID=2620835 RepID=UPI001FFEF6EE|nr:MULTISPECIES: hypothetical protein [unclassified Crossiella]MCK2236588.1 hypothetical protein [Crossiella sp. S99.2]MCK2250255.1 hypothetical protein [Crossiella sp. S99.1]